jgi:hypothetical protein
MLKSLREARLATLLFAMGLMFTAGMLAFAVPKIYSEAPGVILQFKFFQNIMKGLLGAEVGEGFGPGMLAAIPWVHPLVLALVWAHAITHCTRLPVGEVDRGTIDILLSLPASRWQLYFCETLTWIGIGLVVVGAGYVGTLAGGVWTEPDARASARDLLRVAANLYCLYLAVGGIAWFISCLSSHRGRAVGAAFGIVLALFLLNFLAQFWDVAGAVKFLGVLDYYRPVEILAGGAWALRNMAILVSVAVVFWFAGGVWFARRDIRTL